MKFCCPCEGFSQDKSCGRHLKFTAHLFNTGQKEICEICKSLYEPLNKQAHLQSQDCIGKRKTPCEFLKPI